MALFATFLTHTVSAGDALSFESIIASLRGSTNVVLFSIDPDSLHQEPPPKGEKLYGYRVLGKTTLSKKEAQGAISIAIAAMQKSKDLVGAHCFRPRLALSTISNGQTLEYLICFECGWVAVMRDKQEVDRLALDGSPKKLHAMLRRAKVPLASAE